MLSSTIDRPTALPAPPLPARLRLTAPQTLWLGPDGLWDMGCRSDAPSAGGHPADRPAQRHAHFDAWCQAHPGQACALWLSAWGVHELVVDATLPLAGDTGLLA